MLRRCQGLAALCRDRLYITRIPVGVTAQVRTLIQPSFDYRFISDNTDQLHANALARNVRDSHPHRVAKLYDEYRSLLTSINESRSSLNSISKELGELASRKRPTLNNDPASGLDKVGKEKAMDNLRDNARIIKATVQGYEARLSTVESHLRYEAAKIPNLTHPDTPIGDETQARTVRIHGSLHEVGKVPSDGVNASDLSDQDFKDHYDLALNLGIIDMEAGAQVAGSRFHYWRGAGALLELALIQYAMTRAVSAGFTPHITPDVARSSVVDACGFRPRSNAEEARLHTEMGGSDVIAGGHTQGESSQIYRVTPVAEESRLEEGAAAADPLCLVGTAEIPLVAMKQQQILDKGVLPMSLAGLSHCFRAEAGARGRDTRGIYRLHQFTKVELVILSRPESSDQELSRLLDFQTQLYADLGLTFRVLQMPTHELGASAYQKFDIEAWMPGRKAWGEISSASNCTDYQSRRLGIRARLPVSHKGGVGQAPQFVHTLNATAVAVPRLVVAILESFQRPNGHVVVPEVLWPWMMGIHVLAPDSLHK
ncbi:seryl-tRNA synthetase [Coemansia aciculifera]|uniref:serine--tRNA ligase n=1 Tax=Coemansia aciculifera TaxID=417176 RepID=A0A9W8IM98_9FUNG|nr:seryl-tRNA synthetase [Coemansia aciculifera]KAJ2870384.1 seryl-tRNA synthetase [Coemansia aciculifera]